MLTRQPEQQRQRIMPHRPGQQKLIQLLEHQPIRATPKRAGTQVGSFFDAIPGAGGYALSAVPRDWDDADAVRILQWCTEAASETGKVLVVDHIGDAQDGTPDTKGDLRMICYFRGRERTLDQLDELANSAGLQISSVMPARSRSTIELRLSH